jgi:hypothetical protein
VVVKLSVVYPPEVELVGVHAATVTVTLAEVTDVRPVLAKVSVYVPADAVSVRFVNSA